MKTALVTGGTGFVGANLARRLLADGHETHLLVRPSSDPWRIEEIKDDARIWPVDLRDQQSVERVVQEVRPEWIFHLAAYGAYPAQTEPGLMVQTNIVGTMNIVQACMHQLQREDGSFEVVFRGSSGRYAHGKGQAWSELTPDRSCEPLGGRSSQSFGTGQRSTSDAQLWLGGVR